MTEYRDFAEKFAYQAGEIIRSNFGLHMQMEWKGDNTPVTDTDYKVNSMLIDEVSKLFPTHSVMGEEESSASNAEYVWVCDPVDGTIPFSHGIPLSTFSLALVRDGVSILGVVYDPFSDRLFYAEQGKGATLNGKPIHVSREDSFAHLVGAYEWFPQAKYDISKLAHHLIMNEDIKMVMFAAVIYPTVLVAAGELGFSIFPASKPYDAAAIKIIVEEAGGKVTDMFGNEQRYDRPTNGFIASNGVLHEKLVALSKELVVIQNSP